MNRQRQILFLALLTLLLTAGFPASGQTLKPGPQVMSFFSDVDDSEQPYGLYLPANFSPKKKYPLVISLHGAGSNHRLNLRRVFGKSNLQGETMSRRLAIFRLGRFIFFKERRIPSSSRTECATGPNASKIWG